MKWIGLLKRFDEKLSGEWHSGSCNYYNAKSGFNTKEEAEEWVYEMRYVKYGNKRYKFTECVLGYDENDSINVEDFFKWM